MRQLEAVQQRLLAWYGVAGRDLPWRRTRDAYAVLVAEVMLQQTQVERVIPRWHAWLAQFPTIEHLARASRAEAIRAWHGLGYNLRAVRLHALAQQVVAEHGGRLPRDLAGLLALEGVGRYTARAVACFAYEQPVAMVDTNVRRVLSRVFGVPPGEVDRLADRLVPREAAYAWGQALMDLGATLCRGRRPLCLACPLVDLCAGPGPSPTVVARQPRPASEPFRGSRRYYRGRLVDGLRALAPGSGLPLAELVARVAERGAHDHVARLALVLADDGLLSIDADGVVRLAD